MPGLCFNKVLVSHFSNTPKKNIGSVAKFPGAAAAAPGVAATTPGQGEALGAGDQTTRDIFLEIF